MIVLEIIACVCGISALVLGGLIVRDIRRQRRNVRELVGKEREKRPPICPHGIAISVHCPRCLAGLQERSAR